MMNMTEVQNLTVVGVSGSPREGGNTETLLQHTLGVCAAEGLRTEMISLRGLRIEPCRGCRNCFKNKECAVTDDVPAIFERLAAADAIILAAPVYFSGTAGQMKCLIDRLGYMSMSRGRVFDRKVGGAMTVARRAGQNFALAEMMFFFLHQGMIVPGSTYWNMAFGVRYGSVTEDEEGMRTAENFARNLAWTLKKLRAPD
jgi:multimeric flavodoxin WrbA